MTKSSSTRALCLIFLIAVSDSNASKILGLFPHPGKSHYDFFHPLMRGLAEKGHDVDIVTYFADSDDPVKNYKVHQLTALPTLTDSMDLKLFEQAGLLARYVEFFMLHSWGLKSCESTLNSHALAKALETSKKYDIVLLEQFNSDCMLGVAHILNVPVIGLSSSALMPWHYDRVGNPFIPSYIPTIFLGISEEMSFVERVLNWVAYRWLTLLYEYYTQPATNKIVRKKFGETVPDVHELAKNMSLIFVNQHYSLSGAKPLSPSVIDLGGLHIQKEQPLPEDIKTILDTSEHGVIYISWGSMVQVDTLSDSKREGFLNVLRNSKHTVLWRYNNDTLLNKPSNVIIRKWLPQKDILCHPNVKVFFAHGGLLGSSEAAYCGVPTIVTPIYGDQFLNGAALEYRGMAAILPFSSFDEASIKEALDHALKPETLKNAKSVAQSYRYRIMEPLETGIWWVEHVIKMGGSPFTKSASINLPGYIYHSIDIYAFLLIVVFVCTCCWIAVIRFLCCPKKNHVKKLKTK